MWQNAHFSNGFNDFDKISIEESITMNHCKAITKILSDVKLKITVWISGLIIYIGLLFYAFIFLGLSLSWYSMVPLILAGLFIIIMTTSEISRLFILKNSADTLSVMESLLFFQKRLNNMRMVDFILNLAFLYLFIILIAFNYLSDIGGIRNLSLPNEYVPMPFLAFLIVLLLLTPWLIKYQHNQKYKKIYSNLNNSIRILNSKF